MKIILSLVVITINLSSCVNDHGVAQEERKTIKIDIENCKDYIDLKLSDLVDSCWLVQLETTYESVLGSYFHSKEN